MCSCGEYAMRGGTQTSGEVNLTLPSNGRLYHAHKPWQ